MTKQEKLNKLVYKWRKFRFLSEKDRQRLLINLNLMRMVCDSTYIVDQQSRNDTKIDELICILDEYFDGNAEKAVIFSQWERMTRLISQELDKLGIKYEYLHGGVPSSKRKQLFDNFNSDEDCRIFLSTDAGSTGLNLQSASLIVNMDIPWNPAVLEQRIARIYRMGQKSNVSVINFVSRGTIEHRMLDVLKFKTSLSQGILDNGEDSIFLSDSKFNQFMKTIEEIAEPVEKTNTQPNFVSDEELSEKEELNVKEKAVAETPISQTDIFDTNTADENENVIETESVSLSVNQNKDSEPELDATALITQGISFISGFAKALSSPESTEKLVSSLVEKDKVTGKTYMKIPVENEKAITNALNLLGQLFKGLAK